MTTNSPGFLKSFLIFINLCVMVCYVLVRIVPNINTGKYWYIALPGLIFPLIFFGLILFILIWAFAKSRWCPVSILVLLLGTQQILAVFGFNMPKKFENNRSENTLRIL